MVAQLLNRVWRSVDRRLHPWRQDRLRRAVHQLPPLAEVLVVCTGNICRSPFAAALLARRLSPYGITVRSAGFTGAGRPAPDDAITAARPYGIDLSSHRSQPVLPGLLATSDLIIVMSPAHRDRLCFDLGYPSGRTLLLGDADPSGREGRTILDPWDGTLSTFVTVYARIDRCVDALTTLLASSAAISRRR